MSKLADGRSFVVTGGAGFIGSHLIEGLLGAGARRITAVDSLLTSSWRSVPADPRVEQITADLASLSYDDLQRMLSGHDYLFHLAAEKHNQSITTPERLLEVNVNATYRLFNAATTTVRKVVFTSSLYAAGRMSLPPMREDDLPQPKTVYGISKLTGEHLLQHFKTMRSTALRLFFTYGPRQFGGGGYKSVIMTNYERIVRNEAPVINGDGTQSLDYVYVEDVVRALIASLDEQPDGEVINIGSGNATNINDLTAMMLRAAGSSLAPVNAPADWTAGTARVCDRSKAERLLGWTPAISMEEGLRRVYQWLREQS